MSDQGVSAETPILAPMPKPSMAGGAKMRRRKRRAPLGQLAQFRVERRGP